MRKLLVLLALLAPIPAAALRYNLGVQSNIDTVHVQKDSGDVNVVFSVGSTPRSGTLATAFSVSWTSGVVVNETGKANQDFRVETDNQSEALFVDAGGDSVKIAVTLRTTGALHLSALRDTVGAIIGDSTSWNRDSTLKAVRDTLAGTAVAFSAGTSAAPALYPTGDPNTGIYSSGADILDFAVGGKRVLRAQKAGTFDSLTVIAPVFSVPGTTVLKGRLGVGINPTTYPIHFYQNTTGYPMVLENTNNSAPKGLFINFTGAAPDNNTQAFIWMQDNAANRCIVYSDGDLQNADNSYGAISDSTLKTDIADAPDPLASLRAVRVVEWRDKRDSPDRPKSLGVLAQELQETMPTLVDTAMWDSTYVDERGEKVTVLVPRLKVNYMGFVMPLVHGHQRQEARLDSLTAAVGGDYGGVSIGQVVAGLVVAVAGLFAWVKTLKKQVNALEARIAQLEGVAPSPPNPDEET